MFSVEGGHCLCLVACVHFSHCGNDQLWSNLLYSFPPLAFCVLMLCTAPIFIYMCVCVCVYHTHTHIYMCYQSDLALDCCSGTFDYDVETATAAVNAEVWIPVVQVVLGWKSTSFDLFCFI